MLSESGDRRPTIPDDPAKPPAESDPFPCPRCDSTDTKFCYYNNYSLSQPRHYCRSCRRYWTHGGTLRNVPVGGATRKATAAKRHRPRTTSSDSSSSSSFVPDDPAPDGPIAIRPVMESPAGSFDYTWLTRVEEGVGLSGLDGFGIEIGLGSGGIGGWVAEEVGEGNGGRGFGGSSGSDTWQIENVEGVLDDEDSFGWPELAISTPSNSRI